MHKIGIIGYGGMGSFHAKELRAYNRLEVKGVFDVNPDRLSVARDNGYFTYESLEELFTDQEIDIVLIATTNEVHKELSIEAMENGKHVICEKPVTLSTFELQEIIDTSNKCNKVFTINQNRRTNPDFISMKNSYESGIIGKVYGIESRVEGSRGMPSGWRTIKNLGGGMMLDWGVHLIDQLLFMIDKKVTNVFCVMNSIEYNDVDDNFRLTLCFDGGLTAQVEVGTNNYIKHPRWYVLGEKGTLQIEDWDGLGKIVKASDKGNIWEDEIIYTKAGPTKTMAPRRPESIEEILVAPPKDLNDSLTVVYDQFLDAIEGKGKLTITAEQGLRVMKVIEEAFKSATLGIACTTNI